MNATRIALLQSTSQPSIEAAVDHTRDLIHQAADKGAQIICTQELFTTPYFCRTQNPDSFNLAEPIPGPTVTALQAVAQERKVVLVLSLFEDRGRDIYHNTAAVVDADGSLLGIYRKSHIPQDPGFEEKFYFTPGDTGFRSFKTAYGTLGVIICWDQWFPESARLTALAGADIIVCPTAIGWLKDEPNELYEGQMRSWQRVQQGHAVANSCYYAAINRTGTEGDITFWGHSFVADQTGDLIAEAGETEEILLATCDLNALKNHRRIWPFFRDRRTDLYGDLLRLGR